MTARQRGRGRIDLGIAAAIVGFVGILLGMEVALRLGAVGRTATGAATLIPSSATITVACAAEEDVSHREGEPPHGESSGCAPAPAAPE